MQEVQEVHNPRTVDNRHRREARATDSLLHLWTVQHQDDFQQEKRQLHWKISLPNFLNQGGCSHTTATSHH